MSDTSGIESVVPNSIQEPSSGPDSGTTSTGKGDKQHQCIVISLIRHAQSQSNLSGSWVSDDAPTPLTEEGQLQADSLGRNWENTHIDHLLSSPLRRAHDTAKALSSHNKGHPEIVAHPFLVERRYGDRVHRLMQEDPRAAQIELRGSYFGPIDRDHRPAEGGESMNMVALRAENIVRWILVLYGVKLSEAPEFFLEKKKTFTPETLPDGIPHVVIVSHNVFLMELYEKLYSFGRKHSETECDWRNADWSRHILWYDLDEDKLDVVDMKYCGD